MWPRLLTALALVYWSSAVQVRAAGEPGTGRYLEYQEPVVTGGASVSSTFAYILGLLLAFGFVLLLAWLASRFIGARFLPRLPAAGQVLYAMPLDHNKRIVFVEVSGAVLVLGVTEQSVSLLKEIAGAEEIQRLKEDFENREGILSCQSKTLDSLQKKIKPMLRNLSGGKKGSL
jgi:flagellar protein FliO/FliZ